MPLFLPSTPAASVVVAIPHAFCPVLCCCCSCLLQLSPARLFSEGIAYAVRPHRAHYRVPFPHLKRHSISPVIPPLVVIGNFPSLLREGVSSLIASPRCDFTFIRKVALPARTHCVSRQTISRRISASGALVIPHLGSLRVSHCLD
jgi:hypothetical protein